ncbi:hypothetical protein [Rhizobium yanglingense]
MSVFKNLPTPPSAAKKPVSDTRHGITRSDDYAWLRADNWQAMFKDPSILDPEIRRHLEAENAYMNAAMEDTEAAAEDAFCRDARPHQGGRQLGADEGRTLTPTAPSS